MRRAYSSRPGEPRCKVDVGEVKELGEVGGGVEEGEVEGGGGVEEGEGEGGGGFEGVMGRLEKHTAAAPTQSRFQNKTSWTTILLLQFLKIKKTCQQKCSLSMTLLILPMKL